MLSLDDWHERYSQQAGWTAGLRLYIFNQLQIDSKSRWLEVGCGTGAVLQHLPVSSHQDAGVCGLDIALPALRFCRRALPESLLVCGDAHKLPFASASFDVIVCHFLLLWLSNPEDAIAEMAAVARPGGYVVVLAEPDYGNRVDYPPPLEALGKLQTRALQDQGADPFIGRRLGRLLHQAGLQDIHVGVLGGEWRMGAPGTTWDVEWKVLTADLQDQVTPEQLAYFRSADQTAWENGERILFIPTFYGWGRPVRN